MLLLIGIPLCSFVVFKVVGLETIFSPRHASTLQLIQDVSQGNGLSLFLLVRFCIRVPIYVAAVVLTAQRVSGRDSVRSRGEPKPTIGMLVLLWLFVFVVNNPISTARFFVGCIWISFFVLVSNRHSEHREPDRRPVGRIAGNTRISPSRSTQFQFVAA